MIQPGFFLTMQKTIRFDITGPSPTNKGAKAIVHIHLERLSFFIINRASRIARIGPMHNAGSNRRPNQSFILV